jgi:23S rRNA (guanosine2251-2'-O)-methyltransferase
MANSTKSLVLVLDNIRSVHNVGSIFRTADAVGISKIYLCGTTPTPIDRFGRKRSDLHKSALGAEEYLEWEYVESTLDLVKKLKEESLKIIALEQNDKSVDYKGVSISENTAIILGTEVTGIDKEILDLCDIIAEIPMEGKKESLNVSVATGVFLFRIFNK